MSKLNKNWRSSNTEIIASDENISLFAVETTETSRRMPNGKWIAPQVVLKEWCKLSFAEDDWFYASGIRKAGNNISPFYGSIVFFGFKKSEEAIFFMFSWGDVFKITPVKSNNIPLQLLNSEENDKDGPDN